MTNPVINIGVVSNIFVRQMHFQNVDDVELGHKHSFDHLTLLAKGQLRVAVNGSTTDYTAPTMIYIRAEYNHELTALVPDTVAYCIHGLRNEDKTGDLVDPAFVPEGVELRQLIAAVVNKEQAA